MNELNNETKKYKAGVHGACILIEYHPPHLSYAMDGWEKHISGGINGQFTYCHGRNIHCLSARIQRCNIWGLSPSSIHGLEAIITVYIISIIVVSLLPLLAPHYYNSNYYICSISFLCTTTT